MIDINRYIANQNNHIAELMQLPLVGFTNQNGEMATWGDAAWRFKWPDGKSINFFFIDNTIQRPNFNTTFSADQILRDDQRHLLMAYAIEVCAGKTSVLNLSQKHTAARKLVAQLSDNLALVTDSQLNDANEKVTTYKVAQEVLSAFFRWLHSHNFIPPTLKPIKAFKQNILAGEDIIEHKRNKIPENKVLLALGAIFHDVIPQEREKWNTHPLTYQRDAFICAMTALAMSSPNRIDAEQTVLTRQQLKDTQQSVKGKIETIYYLDWHGSKGFKDYKNHILAVMAEPVARCLEYMNVVCEPARALARFYENPSLPLKKVLGKFSPSDKNLNALSPDMNKPIHIVHLGFLLGFYDNGDGLVRVSPTTAGAKLKSKKGMSTYLKPIVSLQPNDMLLITNNCAHSQYLLGMEAYKELLKIFTNKIVTVSQFQEQWMRHIIGNLPGFPVGYNNSDQGQCQYKHALFSFTGNQIRGTMGGYLGEKSHFAIVPLSSLGFIFASSLNPLKKQQKECIFTRHGFSDEFRIKPHQFRHWHNDVADQEGIAHAIINLWSGRKTPEQILHYVYRTHAEKASEISDILFNEADREVTVKVISQQEYEALVGITAAVTSVGFCSQNLQFSPCEYLNDFATQCTLCQSSCHIAHDKQALALLNKDLQVQERRLAEVEQHPKFCISKAMQDWFVVHHQNTAMLSELLALMANKDIKEGSIIRVLAEKREVRITDTKAKSVTVQRLALPNSKAALAKALELKNTTADDDSLDDIFALI